MSLHVLKVCLEVGTQVNQSISEYTIDLFLQAEISFLADCHHLNFNILLCCYPQKESG